MIAMNRPQPGFSVGQIVQHRRYGYRGVIVDLDYSCQASDAWYAMNQTQPDRNQPWYHVLVHDSDMVTYAAETSLMDDDSKDAIDHPMVALFFEEYDGSHYVRNKEPFPGS